MRALPAVSLLVLASCVSGRSTAPASATASSAADASATANSAADAPAFIEDDYATALSQAREKQVPIFVDTWTPW